MRTLEESPQPAEEYSAGKIQVEAERHVAEPVLSAFRKLPDTFGTLLNGNQANL